MSKGGSWHVFDREKREEAKVAYSVHDVINENSGLDKYQALVAQ